MKKFMIFTVITALFAPVVAMANPDSGLYDPLPPQGSAFVRFINLNGTEEGSRPSKANGKTYMYLEHGESSPYFVFKQGTVKANFGEVTKEFDVVEEKLYTIILEKGDETLLVLEDEANTNQAKSQLNVYNMSDAEMISLKAKAGSVDVIKDVVRNEVDSRQINPVKIDLSIVSEEEKLFDAGEKTLERGEIYSLFFIKKDEAIWIQSTKNTRK